MAFTSIDSGGTVQIEQLARSRAAVHSVERHRPACAPRKNKKLCESLAASRRIPPPSPGVGSPRRLSFVRKCVPLISSGAVRTPGDVRAEIYPAIKFHAARPPAGLAQKCALEGGHRGRRGMLNSGVISEPLREPGTNGRGGRKRRGQRNTRRRGH